MDDTGVGGLLFLSVEQQQLYFPQGLLEELFLDNGF